MSWIIFSILAALSLAIVNILDKFILTKWIKNPTLLIMLLGIVGIVVSFFIWIVRGLSGLSFFNMALALIASIFYLLTNLFYFKVTQTQEISRIAPLLRLTPFFVLIFAYFFFGETFGFLKYLGIAFLIIGSLLICIKGSVKLSFGKSLWFTMIAVISSAVSTIITKHLLHYADFWTIFAYLRIGVFVVLIPVFYWNFSNLILTVKKQGKKIIWLLSLNELLLLLSVLFVTVALSQNSATLTTALFSIHPFFVLLFAIILSKFYPHIIKEKIKKADIILKITAIVLIFIGVFLIA